MLFLKGYLLFNCDNTALAIQSSSSRYCTGISVRKWLVSRRMTSLTMMVMSMVMV